MTDAKVKVKPSFIGKNEHLKFIVPQELFKLELKEAIDRGLARKFSKYLRGTFKGFQEARKTKYGNENNKKTEANPEFWKVFESKVKEKGIDLIGYTPVIENFIFYNLEIYGKNTIILGMEMRWDQIKQAPSIPTEIECFRVYSELGDATNELTEYLKVQGYKSEAHHPFGGKMLFPPHAIAAGLGIVGQNGLVITPQFGPRQRWSMITTDADIPDTARNDFKIMDDYCKECGTCIKNCRGRATYPEPIEKVKGSGVISRIERAKCIDSIMNNDYCSVCLKLCPFGNPKSKKMF